MNAVALHTDHLRTSLAALKYNGRTGWALIFGRLIVGWLGNHADEVADIDVIMANPSAPDRQPVQHVETILKAARTEDTLARWPFNDPDDPGHPVLVKAHPTAKSAGHNWQAKMTAAQEHADAIELRGDVKGKRILLIDDVLTTGSQFHTVARYLRNNCGAEEVRGLVLARVPYRT
ncbi:phosphoribosyltransferase family protein [Streptomyces sp. BE20]|uniref:ComF family protein n=1 Tax=Streptomyces sp. BE20 TaxID=3002525 RepID=UPI002E773E00|nr:phosphoribosyltransferase family protein [Streptomyces sp. BE20]MEE1821255.1 phosphoribosyltransferase family protein [Streptomyces sp. BE20]